MDNRTKEWSLKNKTKSLYDIQKEVDAFVNALGEPSKLKAEIESIKSAIKSPRFYGVETGTSAWYDGIDIPTSEIGLDGDYFLQIDNWDIWKKQLGYWERIGNIQGGEGPMGATGMPGMNGTNGSDGSDGLNGSDGMNGRDGSTWYDGSGTPAPELGINGDYFLDIYNADIYKKYYNWERIGNIMPSIEKVEDLASEIIEAMRGQIEDYIEEINQRIIDHIDSMAAEIDLMKLDVEEQIENTEGTRLNLISEMDIIKQDYATIVEGVTATPEDIVDILNMINL